MSTPITPEIRRAIERKPVHREATQIYANTDTQNTGKTSELKRATCDEPLAQGKGEKEVSGRVHFSFVSVRKRLIDPDNLVPKFYIDACRRIGLVKGDEHDKITLETTQRKAAKGEEEHTQITIQYP
jgi:hypothetical protein